MVVKKVTIANTTLAPNKLCVLAREEVEELRHAGKELPAPGTLPLREAVLVLFYQGRPERRRAETRRGVVEVIKNLGPLVKMAAGKKATANRE